MWSAGWGVWLAVFVSPLFPSSSPAHTAKPGNSCPHRRSIPVSFAGDKFCAAYLQRLAAVELFEPRQKIWSRGWDVWLSGHERRNDALALGDLDFLTLTKQVFDLAKPVAQVTYRSFSHVIHFSITIINAQYLLDARYQSRQNPMRFPFKSRFRSCQRS